jgi:hypothetical protein
MDECFDRVRAARDRRLLYIRNDFPHLPWAQRLLYMETSPVTRQTRELYAAGKLRWPENAYMQPTKPAEELYDTVADPHCLHNLADRPDYEADLRRLRGHVEQWVASISDKAMVPEAELIEAGLVKDRREEYFSRKANLPEHLRDGGRYDTTLLMPGSE